MRSVLALIIGIVLCTLGFEALNQSDTIVNLCGVVLILSAIVGNVFNLRRALKDEKW